MTGPVALVGSGEFLTVMEPVDLALLEGRPRRAVIVPTASAPEGSERFSYWMDLGRRHFESLDVEPVPLAVAERSDAENSALAALVAGAGLIYLSGGNPHYLSVTLRDSAVWAAIIEAWEAGAALAGCSAGAMALTAGAPGGVLALPGSQVTEGEPNGLGAVPGWSVIPHFDQLERWRPGAMASFAAWHPKSTTLVGIDEETAMVTAGDGWTVAGRQSVWVFDGDSRTEVRAGGLVPTGRESNAV